MLNAVLLGVKFFYCFAECRYEEFCYAERSYTEYWYAECCYAECCYADRRGVKIDEWAYNKKLFTLVNNPSVR